MRSAVFRVGAPPAATQLATMSAPRSIPAHPRQLSTAQYGVRRLAAAFAKPQCPATKRSWRGLPRPLSAISFARDPLHKVRSGTAWRGRLCCCTYAAMLNPRMRVKGLSSLFYSPVLTTAFVCVQLRSSVVPLNFNPPPPQFPRSHFPSPLRRISDRIAAPPSPEAPKNETR